MDQLVKLAYTMTRKVYPEGSTIRQQGERLDHIILLDKGELLIRQTIATALSSTMDSDISGSIIIQKSKNGKRYKQCPIAVDIAELRHHDLFGVVEYVSKSKKYKRQLLAKTVVEVYFIPIANFDSIMKQEPKTAKMIQELARRRMKWEEVRRDFGKSSISTDVALRKHTVSH
jgi:CRP-like cAMP-binding protein